MSFAKLASSQLALIVFLLANLSSCGQPQSSTLKEAPDSNNLPYLMGSNLKNISEIAESARLETIGWSANYWPTYQIGIANRWQDNPPFGSADYKKYLYEIETFESIKNMPQEKLDRLSPAEKFDLYLDQKNFPLTRGEFDAADYAVDEDDKIPTWFGLCHGWAPAAYMEETPGDKATVTTKDGITLNFYASDLKALVIKQYATLGNVPHQFIGGRCNDEDVERDDDGRVLRAECRDINPASLHVILDDYIAKNKEGFVADVTGSAEVWNQPIVGYSFDYFNERSYDEQPTYRHAAPETTTLIDVEAEIEYLVEDEPSKENERPITEIKYFSYTLELDQEGKIIGGEWDSEERLDFLWKLKRRPIERNDSSTIQYSDLKPLLDLSHNERSVKF